MAVSSQPRKRRIGDISPSRKIWALLFVVGVAYFSSSAYLYASLSSTNRALTANVNAQVLNRAANVRSWCGAINANRDYARARGSFLHHAIHAPPYALPDLNCQMLVAKTLKSAHH